MAKSSSPQELTVQGGPIYRPLPEDGIHIREILGVLRRNVLLLVVLPAVAVAAGMFMTPKPLTTYKASGAIQLLNARRAVAVGLEDQGSDRIARMVDPVQSQIEIIKGRQVLGRAADLSGLRLMPLAGTLPLRYLADVRIAPDAQRLVAPNASLMTGPRSA